MKNILITLLTLLSFSSKSQTLPIYDSLGNVTYYTEDTIKLPFSIAKKITRELVGCDSAKAILDLTKDQLALTEQKVVLKDNIISNYIQKEVLYEQRISNEKEKFNIQGVYVKRLEWDNKKLRIKLTLWKIGFSAGVATAVLGYLYLTK
jgi:hypothetical protein